MKFFTKILIGLGVFILFKLCYIAIAGYWGQKDFEYVLAILVGGVAFYYVGDFFDMIRTSRKVEKEAEEKIKKLKDFL